MTYATRQYGALVPISPEMRADLGDNGVTEVLRRETESICGRLPVDAYVRQWTCKTVDLQALLFGPPEQRELVRRAHQEGLFLYRVSALFGWTIKCSCLKQRGSGRRLIHPQCAIHGDGIWRDEHTTYHEPVEE